MTTPTGAAIAATLVDQFAEIPAMRIDTIGYGAGTRDLEDRPNVLRLMVGDAVSSLGADQAWMLETNLDDVSGEWIAYCTSQLMESGALDVYTTAVQMKKNRPAVVLSVLCEEADIVPLETIIFRETGTLGVRRWPVSRHKLPRKPLVVETPWGQVTGKVGVLAEGTNVFAPEYESCRTLAAESGTPLREVYQAAIRAFNLSPNDQP